MKRLFLLSVFITISLGSYGTLVGVGMETDDIKVWRYFERSGSGYNYRMVIFNSLDTIVSIDVINHHKVYKRFHEVDSSGISTWWTFQDTVIRTTIYQRTITAGSYQVFDLDAFSESNDYLEFELNGKRVGLLVMQLWHEPPPQNLVSKFRFVSPELMQGSRNQFIWVCKNQLVMENVSDTVLFFIDRPYESSLQSLAGKIVVGVLSRNAFEHIGINNDLYNGLENDTIQKVIYIDPDKTDPLDPIVIIHFGEPQEGRFIGIKNQFIRDWKYAKSEDDKHQMRSRPTLFLDWLPVFKE